MDRCQTLVDVTIRGHFGMIAFYVINNCELVLKENIFAVL